MEVVLSCDRIVMWLEALQQLPYIIAYVAAG